MNELRISGIIMISLEKCFSFINEKGPVLVAVSGGSDSMALLHLANAWAKNTGREIHAVTVDHGLRIEAAAEAAFVAMVCEGLDIVHTTLAWDGLKPSSGISAAARHARYALIEEFARDIGVRIILAGHTSDDQAETVLMRLRRKGDASNHVSSDRGHSGMCARTLLREGTILMRPLLGQSRDGLRQYLNDISQSWIEDPSNHDTSYERVRVRRELAVDASTKKRLLQYSNIMGRMREVLARDSVALLRQCCRVQRGHVFELDIEALKSAPDVIADLALKFVIGVAGGAEYLVSDRQLRVIDDQLHEADRNSSMGRMTLGNCIIEWRQGAMQIYREARNLNSTVVASGESHFWDGRLHIENDSDDDVLIGPMDALFIDECKELDATIHGGQGELSTIRRAVLLSLPMLTFANGKRMPLFSGFNFLGEQTVQQLDIRTGARAIENFCPQWDFHILEWLKGIDLGMARVKLVPSTP